MIKTDTKYIHHNNKNIVKIRKQKK